MKDNISRKRLSCSEAKSAEGKIALQFTVRRIKTSPGYEVDISKMPDNPVEFAALLSFVKMACEKTINETANETGFSAKLEK